jgi:CheY-like chemotaxis protein
MIKMIPLALVLLLVVGCGGPDGKVRVVSDDPVAQDVLSVLLEGTGVPVVETTAEPDASLELNQATFREMLGNPLHLETFASNLDQLTTRLVETFPDSQDRIRQNAEAFTAELAKLDAYASELFDRVPEENRTVQNEELADLVAAYAVSVSPDGTSVDTAELLLDGPAETGYEATYLGMMDHNITILAKDLGASNVDLHGLGGGLTIGHDHDH